MEKSQIRVLIVEDDATLGKALSQAIKSEGFTPVLCTTPADALNQIKIQDAQVIVVDCLLPKMSGVDLSVKLRAEGAAQTPLILTSGIFKDKNFSKDAIQKTGAIAFLSKPFDIPDLLKIINEQTSSLVDEDTSPLESVLFSASSSPGEKINAIKETESVDGADLPWIFMLLMHPSVSGVLHLNKDNEKTKAAIHFHKGRIVQVEMQNPESFFGALLIEKGFVEIEQLDQALKTPSTKRIGERLVDMNFLSPHVIDLVNAEQTANRLSRLVTDEQVKLQFEEKAVPESTAYLDIEGIAPFLADWLNSKISLEWLKAKYLRFIDNETQKTMSGVTALRVWQIPPLLNNKEIALEFDRCLSLGSVLAKGKYEEEVVYKVLHMLVLIEKVRFKKAARAVDESAQLSRLERLDRDMEHQDYFSTLGLQKSARPSDIKKVYHDLAKSFHPDRLPPTASPKLVQLTKSVFARMTKAYEVLSNDAKKASYLKELEMGKAEKILQAEAIFEEGRVLLRSGQNKKAKEKFVEASKLKPPTSDLLIHIVWASLASGDQGAAMSDNIRSAGETLNKIPPEDRHNALYYFVKGLYQKATNDFPSAKKNIQHALSLNPKFVEAERALRMLDVQAGKGKPVNLLTGDLSQVVGSFFKKK